MLSSFLRAPLVGPVRRVDAFLVAPGALIGLISFLYHVSYVNRPGLEGKMLDSHVQVWASAMMLYFVAQAAIRARRPTVRVAIANHLVHALCAFLCFLGYAICGFEPAAAFLMFMNTLFAAATAIVSWEPPAASETETEMGAAPTQVASNPSQPDTVEKPAADTAQNPSAPQAEQEDPTWLKALLIYNAFNSVLATIFMILLTVGALTFASGASYSPRGTAVTIDGYKMYYNCEGPKTSTRPVVLIDADATHGMHDFWPLQASLTKAGRRSCIFDKPGVRFSDDFRADQNLRDMSNFYDGLIAAFGERGPYTLLGWGGGTENVYEFGKRNPGNVSSFVFINGYFANVEWRQYQSFKGLTSAQLNAYRAEQLAGRSAIFGVLRGLGVPWGIAGAFVSGNISKYKMPERFYERLYFYTVPKTWTTQYFYFRGFVERGETNDGGDANALGGFSLPPPSQLFGKPLINFANNRSRAALCNGKPAEYCDKSVSDEAFLLSDAIGVANHTRNGTVVVCSQDDCDLGMVYTLPDFIVSQMNALPNYV